MVGEILLFGLLGFLIIFVMNIAGKIISAILACNNKNTFFSFFLDSLTGIVCIVTIYALISTKGKTINLAFIFLFLAYYSNRFFEKSKYRLYSKESIKNAIVSFWQKCGDKKYLIYLSYALIASLLIAFSSILLNHNTSIDNDIIFYTKIAENLGRTGLENIFHYYNNDYKDFNGTSPYHYFELWLSSLIFPFFKGIFSNIIILKYLIYTVLKTVLVLGLLSIVETIKKITLPDLLITVFLTFTSFLFLTEIGSNSWILYGNFWLRPNLIMYFLFLIPALIYFNKKNYKEALFFLLCLPIVSIATAPAIFSGLILILLLAVFFNAENKKVYYQMLLLTFLIIGFIFLFYFLTGVKADVLKTDNKNISELIIHNLDIWKAIIGTTISLAFRVIILLALPVLLVLLFAKNKKSNFQHNLLLVFFAIIITYSGIIIFQLTTSIDNTYQFPYVGFALCYLINLYMICILIYSFEKGYKKVLFLAFLIPLSSLTFLDHMNFNMELRSLKEFNLKRFGVSNSFSEAIEHYIIENPSAKGGFMFSKRDIAIISVGQRHSLTYTLGNYISFLSSNTHLTSLTDPDILYLGLNESERHFSKVKSFNEQLNFYQDFQISNLPFHDFLKQYLKSNNYDYLITSNDIDLSFLSIEKSFTDTIKKHQFIVLKGG